MVEDQVVYIVEDDEAQRHALAVLLETSGREVDPVSGTTSAEAVQLEAPPFRPPEIVKLQELAVAAAVGMWATRQRWLKRSVISRSLFAERAAGTVAPDRHRRPVCQRLVRTPVIIKSQPFADPGSGLAAVGVAFEVDVLVFQAAPTARSMNYVVDPAAPPASIEDADAGRRQHAGEVPAGELAALVGVEDLPACRTGRAPPPARRKAEPDIHRVRQQPPGQHRTARPVDDLATM